MKKSDRFYALTLLLFLLGVLQTDIALADITSTLRRAAGAGSEVIPDIQPKSFDRAASRIDTPFAPGEKRLDPDLARAALNAIDPGLLRQVDDLAPLERQFALELFEGGRSLKSANPDEFARARLIAEGGTDLLIAAQRHGDQVAKPAYMLQIAEEAGQLPAGAVSDFSRISVERGAPFVTGWNRHILPNWKSLVASGAVLACLAASEACIDGAGNLVGHAAETASKLGVAVGTAAVTGTARGAGEAIIQAFRGTDAIWFSAGLMGLGLSLWITRRLLRSAVGLPKRLAARVIARIAGTRMAGTHPQPTSKRTEHSTGNTEGRPSLRNRDI